jgi:hypothetical protein
MRIASAVRHHQLNAGQPLPLIHAPVFCQIPMCCEIEVDVDIHLALEKKSDT